ncbi:alanine racemase [Pseudoclavibacter sp. JAI123]|uniref:alanine racemase n=1 Tax=Pseudoclavibacter sp. JAI123 TaxID=2723065 RepID=UPI0015CD5E12|nr:alanine racemase [Pseudoclavibacter sp. JAI123]NYF12937.1 alanine racemase [Pseudoclavibacter sp. JAI123]
MTGARIDVDLDAIRANVRAVAELTGTPLLAVVKANAYGHGASDVARAALEGGAERLGVVDLAEAFALRAAGITAPILAWMHGARTDWLAALGAEIELGISSLAQLELLDIGLGRLEHSDRSVAVHLKLDTGLGRNGISVLEWEAAFTKAAELEQRGIIRLDGLFSHLAGAGHAADVAQLTSFERALDLAERCGLTPSIRHLAATAGSMTLPEARLDLVRLGVSLYGLSPFSADADCPVALRPALALSAPIREDQRGFRVDVGHAAGLPPVAPGSLLFTDDAGAGWRLASIEALELRIEPVDADVAPSEQTAARDEQPRLMVIDADRSASADDWAAAAGTINYEVVTRLSARIPRRPSALGGAAPDDAAGFPARTDGLAPRRELTVDVELLRTRMGERARGLAKALADGTGARQAARMFSVDVSADAYGLGARLVAGLALEHGLLPVVATTAELVHVGESARSSTLVDHERTRDAGTRAVYGFDGLGAHAAVSLASELVHVKRVAAGHGVSYGYDWVAEESTILGLVPLGYADAIPRRVAGRAEVVVGGRRRPIVGRVAMDQVVIDLQDQEAWIGMPVSVFGSGPQDIRLDEWASWSGVEPRAFVAALGTRVVRRELQGEGKGEADGS